MNRSVGTSDSALRMALLLSLVLAVLLSSQAPSALAQEVSDATAEEVVRPTSETAAAVECGINRAATPTENVRAPLVSARPDRYSVKAQAVDLAWNSSGYIEVETCRDGMRYDITPYLTFTNNSCPSTPTRTIYDPDPGNYEAQARVYINQVAELTSEISTWSYPRSSTQTGYVAGC